ncbi:uncharacterized protein LOC118331629 [Morone saxatilis]|uniref:uncharacterized protein LOC118331629 n=1 Tax=Morone saxatilis TaxID=34816 RepID=UPI0015E1D4EC|nr:uncharacterized protein LOC118331629 [Morone saxatilis]
MCVLLRGGRLCLERDGCGEVLKEEAEFYCCQCLQENEGSRTAQGMIGNSSLLAAVLTVVSVVTLSLLSALCLRCKRKSKVIHEEHQIYNPQTFQRGGSMFAVTQSKPVTRANQIPSTTIETGEESPPGDFDDEQDYVNIPEVPTASAEHTYVAPIAISVYENEQTEKKPDVPPALDVYANVTLLPVKEDEDDYENADYLEQVVHEEDKRWSLEEPDYVNENGD